MEVFPDGATITPAQITGPFIAGDGVTFEAYCVIPEGSVIGKNATIKSSSTIETNTIWGTPPIMIPTPPLPPAGPGTPTKINSTPPNPIIVGTGVWVPAPPVFILVGSVQEYLPTKQGKTEGTSKTTGNCEINEG